MQTGRELLQALDRGSGGADRSNPWRSGNLGARPQRGTEREVEGRTRGSAHRRGRRREEAGFRGQRWRSATGLVMQGGGDIGEARQARVQG
jgi:hypothetical protein